MTNQTFSAPTLPTPAKAAAKKVWTPNTATKLALTLLILIWTNRQTGTKPVYKSITKVYNKTIPNKPNSNIMTNQTFNAPKTITGPKIPNTIKVPTPAKTAPKRIQAARIPNTIKASRG